MKCLYGSKYEENSYYFVNTVSLNCLSGCVLCDGDGHLARNNLLELLTLIENKEVEKIEALFSPNAKKNIENLQNLLKIQIRLAF